MALTAVRLKKVGNTDVVEVSAGSGGDGEVECEDGGGGGDDALIDECSSGGGGEVAVDAGDGEGDTGGTTDCGDEPAKEILVEEAPTKTEAPKKSTSSVKYDYAEESAPSSVAKYESQEESAPAATIANRIFTSTPKAIQLTSSLKRNNSSGDTNERPVKNAKFPVVYALTPSSTGGLTGAQQLTPITRPVTLTKIQNITTMSGSENKTFSGTGVKLVPGTVIKLAGNKKFTIPMIGANGNFNTGVARRPTIYIKAPVKKTIRTVTEELIAKSPKLHVGMSAERLTILKNVAFQKAKIPFVDLLITLKKLRLNESFALLAEYFEYPESEVEKIFSRTVIKLAKYLKFLIRWPDGEKYCERHKNLPITFRSKLSYVQSLIECVETEIRPEACPTLDTIDCKFFKFILAITPAGVISYVSEAFVGNHDDLAIFNACNFQNLIPKYLSLVADPGQALANHRSEFETDSTTDSADETEEHSIKDVKMRRFTSTGATTAANKLNACAQRASNNLNIVNSQLTSSKVKDFSIPTLRVREPACRQQIRDIIYTLREFKILQPYAILEPHLYQYINEILVIVSALTNFQR
ncbi:unnamed protein product [Hermetia illucens]|uniref:Uncharacterized protein n=1 Tax=Hermetia illucens TaxID=343691 RepID=A0A7R8YY65_HERIL|nr:uncharacterized protein LOC119654799 isoform X1 [Hermetia illucens]CAD7089135.1 unnamed protein product [Hermetia illucens]